VRTARSRSIAAVLLALQCAALVSCKKQAPSGAPSQPQISTSPSAENKQPPQAPPAAPCKFEWLDAKRQAAIWSEVAAAFHQELIPDPPAADDSHSADAYTRKQISRVAGCGDAVLVVLEKSTEIKDQQDWNRLFELYSFNLSTKAKSAIEAKWPFWLWEFHQLAHFEDGLAPDITFEAMSCTECEPVILLSSLRLDSNSQKWELRQWPKGDQGIELADAAVGIDGSVEEYATVSGIGDFDGKGFDEVAVWTHYRDVDEKDPNKPLPAVTTLTLFGYRNGLPVEIEVKDPVQMVHIKNRLCEMNSQEAACKNPKSN
jgi:hypothetical protein